MSNTYERIYALVSQIPYGRVATYGQIARLAGRQGQARLVGYALSALTEDSGVPWHRVINARGEISVRAEPGSGLIQRELLEQEGIIFERTGQVSLSCYQWHHD